MGHSRVVLGVEGGYRTPTRSTDSGRNVNVADGLEGAAGAPCRGHIGSLPDNARSRMAYVSHHRVQGYVRSQADPHPGVASAEGFEASAGRKRLHMGNVNKVSSG